MKKCTTHGGISQIITTLPDFAAVDEEAKPLRQQMQDLRKQLEEVLAELGRDR